MKGRGEYEKLRQNVKFGRVPYGLEAAIKSPCRHAHFGLVESPRDPPRPSGRGEWAVWDDGRSKGVWGGVRTKKAVG